MSLILSSCAIKWKGHNKSKPKKLTEKELSSNSKLKKSNNWADEYYKETTFIIKKPIVKESYKQLVKICKGNEFSLIFDYQSKTPKPVKFKGDQITVLTKSGFSKKLYLTKGACRELSLFKSKIKKEGENFRKSIKQMNLMYIYNKGTYLTRLEFNTAYKGVDFIIE